LSPRPRSGGRAWWAHFEFTRINIAPTILRKKIEDLREAGAATSIGVLDVSVSFFVYSRDGRYELLAV
jgi:hypothetical protein